jgi:SAM-dependent methyltransferase
MQQEKCLVDGKLKMRPSPSPASEESHFFISPISNNIMGERIDIWENRIKPLEKCLDIGCWDGYRVKRLLKKCDAYGIDIDKNKFRLADKSTRKRLFLLDATKKLPFNNNFDWVFCTEVIEHIEHDNKLIQNFKKVLKKGGHLILTTPKKISGFDFWDPAWVRWKFGGKNRHYHYSKEELFKKLEKSGFEIEEYYVRGSLRWFFIRWINVFLRYALKNKKQIDNPMNEGYFDWAILAKIKK